MKTDPVDNDFTNWDNALSHFGTEADQRDADKAGYANRLSIYDQIAAATPDPMVRYQLIVVYFMMNLNTSQTAFGQMDDEIGVKGAALDVSTKGNAVIGDISAIIQQGQSLDPKDPNGPKLVKDFAADLDKFINYLDTKVNAGRTSIDPGELAQIRSMALDARQMIYIEGSPPSPNNPPAPGPGSPAIMDPDKPSTTGPTTPGQTINIQTFSDLFSGAQDKDAGIQAAASGGIKTSTNSFSTITTNFGAINQAVKVGLQQDANTQKTAIGWYDNGALHEISDTVKIAVQNQRTG